MVSNLSKSQLKAGSVQIYFFHLSIQPLRQLRLPLAIHPCLVSGNKVNSSSNSSSNRSSSSSSRSSCSSCGSRSGSGSRNSCIAQSTITRTTNAVAIAINNISPTIVLIAFNLASSAYLATTASSLQVNATVYLA